MNKKAEENKQIKIIFDQNDNNNNEKNNNKNQKINKNEPIKVCTCIGYVFFQKKLGDKDICIFYDYDSCCSWFSLKIKKPTIIYPFFMELFVQLIVVGFNFILSDNFLKVYSFKKNLEFSSYLLISDFYIYFLYFFIAHSHSNALIIYTFSHFSSYSLLTFIISIIYLACGKPSGQKWENLMMVEFMLMKMLDLYLLTLYDFFDDLDCLNTSIVITSARYLWIIIEVLIDVFEINTTILISLQIGFSFICSGAIFLIFIPNFWNFFKNKKSELNN